MEIDEKLPLKPSFSAGKFFELVLKNEPRK